MKNFTIIFRITNACNLNCTYCYDKNNRISIYKENENFKFKIPDIIRYIDKLWQDKDDYCELIFHGGEPLVINPENYDLLMEKIKKSYKNVKFSIQTNGTLLNAENIKVLKKYNVHIGISLDGYNDITNKHRIYKNGKNSFNTVMNNINLLKEQKIGFGIIMTLTKNILGKENELYNFIKINKLKCNLRPAFASNSFSNIDFMDNNDYHVFFKNMFNLWIEDVSENRTKLTQIRELYDEFAKTLDDNYNNYSCSSSGKCAMNFISLDVTGNLFACNRTYNNSDFFYGNIEDISIDSLKSKIKSYVITREAEIKKTKCGTCKLYKECKGGCPANAYSIYNSFNMPEDTWCIAKYKIREYVNNYLDKNGIKKDYEKIKYERNLYKK